MPSLYHGKALDHSPPVTEGRERTGLVRGTRAGCPPPCDSRRGEGVGEVWVGCPAC